MSAGAMLAKAEREPLATLNDVLAERAIAELEVERERWHRGLNMTAYVDQRIEWIRVQAQRTGSRRVR